MATLEETPAYARDVKRQRPRVTTDELRTFLKARFVDGEDPRATLAAAGAVANSLDWIRGLAAILRGIGKLWEQDVSEVMELIEGALIIVQEPTAPAR